MCLTPPNKHVAELHRRKSTGAALARGACQSERAPWAVSVLVCVFSLADLLSARTEDERKKPAVCTHGLISIWSNQ